MVQSRKIERNGVLLLSAEERRQLTLWVVVRVLQRPRNEYVNSKYAFPEGWYGTWQSLANGYVVDSGVIKYYNHQIYYHYRIGDEVLEALSCYEQHNAAFFANLSMRVAVPLPYLFAELGMANSVIPPIDAFVFKLPQGCIVEVSCGGNLFKDCVFHPGATDEPPAPPPTPPGDGGELPPIAPPPGSPPNTSPPGWGGEFEISPPYDGQDDGGLTYVPPVNPPWEGDPGQNQNYYMVEVEIVYYFADGTRDKTERVFNRLIGPIRGLGTYGSASDRDARYGVKHGNNQLRDFGPQALFRLGEPKSLGSSYQHLRIVRVTLSP